MRLLAPRAIRRCGTHEQLFGGIVLGKVFVRRARPAALLRQAITKGVNPKAALAAQARASAAAAAETTVAPT